MKKLLICILLVFAFIPFAKAEDQQPIAILGIRTIEKLGPYIYFIVCVPPNDRICLIHDPVSGQVYFPDSGQTIHYSSISSEQSSDQVKFIVEINE